MRMLWLMLFTGTACLGKAPPDDLSEALKSFRSDPPPGWSFMQTTIAEGKSTIEFSDAAKPAFDRWTLVQKDGRAPTADELKVYADGRSRRSRAGTAPKITDQLDFESLETIQTDTERTTYRCRLRPGESRDKTAPNLRATLRVHRPTRTIESIELVSAAEFSPTFGVKIASLKTRMTYSLPTADRPSMPLRVETQVRGTAFVLKSLDADMAVTFSDYAKATRK